jgi:hypothetical protein
MKHNRQVQKRLTAFRASPEIERTRRFDELNALITSEMPMTKPIKDNTKINKTIGTVQIDSPP